MKNDSDADLQIYLMLLTLTVVTAASAYHGMGRLLAVVLCVAIATMKASLIGYQFMGLRREGILIYAIVACAAAAVAALAIGILPDMALRL